VGVAALVAAEIGETAEKIWQFIQANPGCHLRKIKDTIHISQGTVQYHTDRLEKLGKISSTRSGLYKHYFPIGIFQNNEKEILQILSEEIKEGKYKRYQLQDRNVSSRYITALMRNYYPVIWEK
jgi:predicted transcriptional regulator